MASIGPAQPPAQPNEGFTRFRSKRKERIISHCQVSNIEHATPASQHGVVQQCPVAQVAFDNVSFAIETAHTLSSLLEVPINSRSAPTSPVVRLLGRKLPPLHGVMRCLVNPPVMTLVLSLLFLAHKIHAQVCEPDSLHLVLNR